MSRISFPDHGCYVIPVDPAVWPNYRRSNLIIIWSLSFIVLGVFAMALTPESGHASLIAQNAPLKIDANPAPVNLAQAVSSALQGVQFQNLTPVIARDLDIPADTRGIVITSVDPSSAAAGAQLKRGDVILEVNRKPVENIEELNRALAATRGQSVLLLIRAGASTHFVVVEPQ